MTVRRLVFCTLVSLLWTLSLTKAADAQATRTWVSGVGDDVNPCSRTAPCKTFAGAISKTAAGGTINVLDPGGFGAVTITKSISIEAEGATAGVLVSGTNGIIVNAGASDVVVLRGLTIEGLGTGINGIHILAGRAVHVERCTINGFTGAGINFVPAAGALFVKDTNVRNNIGGGILVRPSSGQATASIDNVRAEGNTAFGVRAEDRSVVMVNRSIATGNASNGFVVASGAGGAEMTIYNSVSAGNGNSASTGGVRSTGVQSVVRLQNVSVIHNSFGLVTTGGGQIASWGNNYIAGNTFGDGQPTFSLSQH